jgi:hypothetical protein
MFFPMTIQSPLPLKILFASWIVTLERQLGDAGRSSTEAQRGRIQRAVRGIGTLIMAMAGICGLKALIGMLRV